MFSKVISILCICVLTTQISAQFYDIHTFKSACGLPQPQDRVLFQDSYGFIWIGNCDGLARFDGKSFQHLDTQNGLCSNSVNAFAEDHLGNLWIGTDTGLSRLKNADFFEANASVDCFQLPSQGAIEPIRHLFFSSDSMLWIDTDLELSTLDLRSPVEFSNDPIPIESFATHPQNKEPFSFLWLPVLLLISLLMLLLRYSFLKFDFSGQRSLPSPPREKIPLAQKSHFFIKKDRKQIRITSNNLTYIKGAGDYVEIHTKDNKILVRYTMKGILAKLPDPENFLRVHRSWIVRLDQIKIVKDDSVVIGQTKIPLGISYKAHFKNTFARQSQT